MYKVRKISSENFVLEVSNYIRNHLTENNIARIALSGGKTPIKYLYKLALTDLRWNQIEIFQVDERWVTPEHIDSNERLITNELLFNISQKTTFHCIYNSLLDIGQASRNYGQLLDVDNLDLVILGMGDDGHIASLFPGDNNRNCTDATCVVSNNRSQYARVSITFSTILNSNMVFLVLAGEKKLYKFMEYWDSNVCLPVNRLKSLEQEKLRVYYLDD